MNLATSSWKSGGDADVFPDGLRVLAVDDDRTCLMILQGLLKKCNYQVTTCKKAKEALSLLRKNKNGFDVVISDVHMPDMDGFKLLELIGLEMDLPVIMLSADDSRSVVMNGVMHGACDYLIKPVSIRSVSTIWQHVVRKKKKNERKDVKPSTSLDQHQKQPQDENNSSSGNEGRNGKNTKRRKDEEDEAETDERDDSSSSKKPRVVWSQELHQQFLAAVSHLGCEKAVPKKILDLMNVPGLTRENVASHLQKFRLYLRRLSVSQPSGGINTPFMDNPGAGYGSISSHNEVDLEALAASGQLPGQSFASLQAVALGMSGNLKAPMSLVDEKNFVSFENPKLRFGQGQNTRNFLHGIPTSMEANQLVGLQRSSYSFMNNNSQGLIPMSGQSQIHNHGSRVPVIPNPAFSQMKYPKMEPKGNNYPRGGSPPAMAIPGLQQQGFVPPNPSYGVMNNNVNQNDWGLGLQQSMNGTFHPTYQHTNTTTNNMQGGGGGGGLLNNNYNCGQKMEGNFYIGEGSGTYYPMLPKAENVEYYPEEYNQDDLVTVFLSQQQQQQAVNEVGMNWHSLDNLPA